MTRGHRFEDRIRVCEARQLCELWVARRELQPLVRDQLRDHGAARPAELCPEVGPRLHVRVSADDHELDLLALERDRARRALALHDRQIQPDLLRRAGDLTGQMRRARRLSGLDRIGENLVRGLRCLAVTAPVR